MKLSNISSRLIRDFPAKNRYLIGVSGGRDSVALLHWVVSLGYTKLVVCHLNHQLRGRSSDADARFVEKLAAGYERKIVGQALRLPDGRVGKQSAHPTTRAAHIDLELGTADVLALARKRKMSIETAAREARYSFFAKVAKRRRCRLIFLAHHADDLVETFLLNLFRGAGGTGLAAMRSTTTRHIDGIDLTIVRPLLGTWRTLIDAYVKRHRLKFREDASNKDTALLRNRVRRQIIPYLEKAFNRNIRQHIWRTATILAEEENWIDNQLSDSKNHALSVTELRKLPAALQRRQILKWLKSQDVAGIGFDLIERIRSLLDYDVAKVNLSQDRHARRRTGRIFLE